MANWKGSKQISLQSPSNDIIAPALKLQIFSAFRPRPFSIAFVNLRFVCSSISISPHNIIARIYSHSQSRWFRAKLQGVKLPLKVEGGVPVPSHSLQKGQTAWMDFQFCCLLPIRSSKNKQTEGVPCGWRKRIVWGTRGEIIMNSSQPEAWEASVADCNNGSIPRPSWYPHILDGSTPHTLKHNSMALQDIFGQKWILTNVMQSLELLLYDFCFLCPCYDREETIPAHPGGKRRASIASELSQLS